MEEIVTVKGHERDVEVEKRDDGTSSCIWVSLYVVAHLVAFVFSNMPELFMIWVAAASHYLIVDGFLDSYPWIQTANIIFDIVAPILATFILAVIKFEDTSKRISRILS